MELLYAIFIFPLETLMELTLEGVMELTDNPILSLIGVSLVVTLGSLPLYHIAEKWQDSERAIQKRLKPKVDEFKAIFKGSALNTYLHALYRQNGYHPVYAVRTSFGLLIQIPFFFAAYHLLSNYEAFNGVDTLLFSDLSKPDGMLKIGSVSINIMPFIMTGINFISAFIYTKKISGKEKFQIYGIALLFLVALYNSSSALLFYWTVNNFLSLLKNVAYNIFYPKGELRSKTGSVTTVDRNNRTLFVLSFLTFGILLFFAGPLTLISSGTVKDFGETFFFYASYLLMQFVLFSVISMVLYYYLKPVLQRVFTYILVFLSIFGLFNVFLFPGDYGDMSHFTFETDIAASTGVTIFNLSLLFIIFALLLFIFYNKRIRFLIPVFYICLISVSLLSLKESYKFRGKRVNHKVISAGKIDKAFTFSKDKKNVVVFMLDRFIGGNMLQVLEFLPELNSQLDGFVWYSDSLSPSSFTIGGVPAIMGGWDYNIHEIHNSRQDVPMMDKLNESARVMPYNFKKSGYDVSIYSSLKRWLKKSDKKYFKGVRHDSLYEKYTKLWLNEHKKLLERDNTRKKLVMFGLFRVSPPFLRKTIYDRGKWNISDKKRVRYKKRRVSKKSKKGDKYGENKNFVSFEERNKGKIKRYVNDWSALDYLPEISKVSSSAPGQFYYISTDLTHEPYITNDKFDVQLDGNVRYPRKIYDKFAKNIDALKHLYTDTAAIRLIAEWIEWMKENGVYDNTRIILVSDHGRNIYNPLFKSKIIPGSRKKIRQAFFNNLLLIKDFDDRGKLKRSSDFMTACDVPYLAMEGIVDGVNPYTGNPVVMPENKFPFYVYAIEWREEKQETYKFGVRERFQVSKGSIFDIKNWKVVKDER